MKTNNRFADEKILPPDNIEPQAEEPSVADDSTIVKPKMTTVRQARFLVVGIIIVLADVLLVIYGGRIN